MRDIRIIYSLDADITNNCIIYPIMVDITKENTQD